ncbi:MAG TPA: hypothetical protein DCE09_02660 [Thermoanaerobacter sp.]|nr:hypothetical protein [Thermoanaerobacter sp.]
MLYLTFSFKVWPLTKDAHIVSILPQVGKRSFLLLDCLSSGHIQNLICVAFQHHNAESNATMAL